MDKEDVLKKDFKKDHVDFTSDCERIKRSNEKRMKKTEKIIRKSDKKTIKHKKFKNSERKLIKEMLDSIKNRMK